MELVLQERAQSAETCVAAGADEQGLWQLRATACEFFAASLRYPERAFAAAVASGEWADAAEELSRVCGWELPAGLAAQAACDAQGHAVRDAEGLMHALRGEQTRLFVGPPTPVVSPYEGVRRASEEGSSPLLFVSAHSLEVERFMRACGIENAADWKMPVDHVACELEFMELLAASAAGLPQASDLPFSSAVPGGSAAGAYRLFEQEHVRAWVPGFARDLEQKSSLPIYRALGRMLACCFA